MSVEKKSLILLDGGAEGSRTPDLLIANETLYQLSYDPIHFIMSSLCGKWPHTNFLLLTCILIL